MSEGPVRSCPRGGQRCTLVAWSTEACSVRLFTSQICLSIWRVVSIILFLQIQQ